MMSIRTAKIKVNIKHQEKQSEFVQKISGALMTMNLFWLNFIKFFFGTRPQLFGHGR